MEGEVELRNFLVAEGQTACLLHPARKSRPWVQALVLALHWYLIVVSQYKYVPYM
jgi:hypothetical protein